MHNSAREWWTGSLLTRWHFRTKPMRPHDPDRSLSEQHLVPPSGRQAPQLRDASRGIGSDVRGNAAADVGESRRVKEGGGDFEVGYCVFGLWWVCDGLEEWVCDGLEEQNSRSSNEDAPVLLIGAQCRVKE
ncbi:hypothetical protein BV22DRAFT_1041179 [Leucogyrophana mollusca]|uniref:Uncharacterized protein n=1 Tax=Leucogyrophana mollusca TaxID=85980 RepID=A0ACB8B028_9AGAM|nr:hypothetical protein BV22DRAFT_1041179 [Leucogyrophana mollusca]